jgi:hypothetical protein
MLKVLANGLGIGLFHNVGKYDGVITDLTRYWAAIRIRSASIFEKNRFSLEGNSNSKCRTLHLERLTPV